MSSETGQRRVVLVHGAWHGAWAWAPVADALRDSGHEVVAVDLPGADGNVDTTLRDQVRAVADALADSPAEGSLVVAHSHGGLVAQEAASVFPGRVAGVIGVDAWFAPDRGTFLEVVPSWMAELIEASVIHRRGSGYVPVPPAAMFGIEDPALAARVTPRLRAQPFATFTGMVSGFSLAEANIPGIGIVCEPRTLPFDRLAADQGLEIWPITSGHDVMLLKTAEFTDMLTTAIAHLESAESRIDRVPASMSWVEQPPKIMET
ncbi:hypothetical protein Sru01_59230 [Sphaerisporangium rufum]|uniref:AB hydrolase-1 domain-containing protein n=1 Tax=Sphaerisporangium rufum TaxID=1381558 RepID=A0A919R9K1_9ACTN|nr:alpha/beta fold hydrolase [Sphaerisporangium rufum]GII80941.1 hypothetical protein Sru01_59230 [Sphaerisporangium rufum]